MANFFLYCLLIGQLLCGCHGDWHRGSPRPIGQLPTLSESLISYVNSLNTTWKAGVNFPGKDASFAKLLLGEKLTTTIPNNRRLPLKPQVNVNAKDVPDQFDAIEKWPDCQDMKKIYDQGACGAGWAFGAAEAMSDRYCIVSKMKQVNVTLSAENLISCCGISCGFGCEGGYASAAWNYWLQTGIVTGGEFDSNQGCQPYTFHPCEHSGIVGPGRANSTCKNKAQTPVCKAECRKGFNDSYKDDLHFGKSAYAIVSNITQIEEEIMTFGPVETSLDVYEDFLSYRSGIYQHVTGELINKHSVKLYGWGVTPDGVKYWMASNSWNNSWGEKGFFRILRGTNECRIEDDVHAGTPIL